MASKVLNVYKPPFQEFLDPPLIPILVVWPDITPKSILGFYLFFCTLSYSPFALLFETVLTKSGYVYYYHYYYCCYYCYYYYYYYYYHYYYHYYYYCNTTLYVRFYKKKKLKLLTSLSITTYKLQYQSTLLTTLTI